MDLIDAFEDFGCNPCEVWGVDFQRDVTNNVLTISTLFLIAGIQYTYITYLGYAALPFVVRSEILLAPLLPIFGGYVVVPLGPVAQSFSVVADKQLPPQSTGLQYPQTRLGGVLWSYMGMMHTYRIYLRASESRIEEGR